MYMCFISKNSARSALLLISSPLEHIRSTWEKASRAGGLFRCGASLLASYMAVWGREG